MFTPYVVNGLPLGFQCNCGSAEARDIVCIDEHGMRMFSFAHSNL